MWTSNSMQDMVLAQLYAALKEKHPSDITTEQLSDLLSELKVGLLQASDYRQAALCSHTP